MKFALVVGLDYPYSTRLRLRGARRDATRVARFLRGQGYAVQLVTDGYLSRVTKPRLIELIRSYAARDQLTHFFFYFSGHGASVPSTSSQEVDGRDEALVCDRPVGASGVPVLLDDDMHRLMNEFDPGAQVSVLVDACHSGTICDLALVRIGKGIVQRQGPTRRPVVLSIGSARDDEPALEYKSAGVLTSAFLAHAGDGHRQSLELSNRMNNSLRSNDRTVQQCVLSASMDGGFTCDFY